MSARKPKGRITVNGLTRQKGGGFKLTARDARAIRGAATRKRNPATHTELAKKYGVGRTMVGNIVRGESWKEA